MTTRELLVILRDRGLKVKVREDGTPVLVGPREEVSPALLRVLAFHRQEIVDLYEKRLRQFGLKAS